MLYVGAILHVCTPSMIFINFFSFAQNTFYHFMAIKKSFVFVNTQRAIMHFAQNFKSYKITSVKYNNYILVVCVSAAPNYH